MKKRFQSFEEIDDHLKILKLRKSIHKEYMVLHYGNLKNTLQPRRWFGHWDNTLQGFALSWALLKLLRRKVK